ncbi:MAG: hypothetical protein JW973_07100 [Bacteroidales bacterium]|nr:hypothetical protein [Bacteroidales bacterium]
MSEELQMLEYKNIFENPLSRYSDEQIYNSTGIHNWSGRYYSYSKILNRHSIFLHDEAGIYFIDQIALTFTSSYSHLFFKYPEYFQDFDFESRYRIDDELVMVNCRGQEHQYYHFYKIEYNGRVFGEFSVHKTSDTKLSRLQIANHILYTESPITIISFLADFATKFDLQFSNYCNYDVAFDSIRNYYNEICIIYYQSDFCSSAVHEAHNSKPIFTSFGKRRVYHHEVDPEDISIGTFSIGSKNSATNAKIYVKTFDNEKKGKTYISHIHDEFFGKEHVICRIEGCAFSEYFHPLKPFGKMKYDLMDLLSSENFKKNFQFLIGDKLKFRKIVSSGWDKNRNPVFETIEALKLSDLHQYREIHLTNQIQPSTQNKVIDEFKELLYRYMEGKIPIASLISYISICITVDVQKRKNLLLAIEKAKRNFKNPISKRKRKLIKRLQVILNNNKRSLQILKIRLYLLLLF